MSNTDLMQLWYLPGEIQYLNNELHRISGWRVADDMCSAVGELLDILGQRLSRCQTEYNRGMDFITALPDGWTQTVFRLRYVERLSWPLVGVEMGLTPDCCRKMVHRYLGRCEADTPPNRKAQGKETTK